MNIEYIVSPEYAVKKVNELLIMRRAYLRGKSIRDEERVLDDDERKELVKARSYTSEDPQVRFINIYMIFYDVHNG